MCQENPETGAKEYKAEANSVESYEVVGYHHGLSPILIDINFLKEPDLLAGPYWQKNRKGDIEPAALRSFDLDNKGPKNWEWVGPRTGLLIWSDKGPEIQPTGYNLFGNVTWNQQWLDGYEPLAALDKDKNGQLKGTELDNLFVWLDLNSDAIAQAGEIKPISDYEIISIGVKPTRDSDGNSHLATGFETQKGLQGHTWDWWSREGAVQNDHKVVYAWKPLANEAKIPGGMFVFTKDAAGQLHMMSFVPSKSKEPNSTSMIGFPFNVERHGQKLRWQSALQGQEIVTDAVIEDGKIIGVTRVFRKGSEPFRYTWIALPANKETL